MICCSVIDERKLGYNACFFVQWGLPTHVLQRISGLAVATWEKPAVRWVKSTSEVTQPSPIGS